MDLNKIRYELGELFRTYCQDGDCSDCSNKSL